ncbi:MAG: hypothetical protein ACPG4F_13300 [Paracoccaceae bacterium]
MTEKTGGCHCGDVSLKTNFDPMLVAQCNCGRCRQLFGTVNVGMMYAEDQIEFSGSMSHYKFTGGSGMPVKPISAQIAGAGFTRALSLFRAWWALY